MNDYISPKKAGLALASLVVGWHLCWSVLVAAGAAQVLIDFILWMHFIKPVYVIEPFDFSRAAILLVVSAAVGVTLGSAFAWIWNAGRKA
jgi:hypothetical protein